MEISFEQAVYLFAQKHREQQFGGIVRRDAGTDDVEWITVKGNHIPLDDEGKAIGGAGGWAKGKDFSKAKPVIHFTDKEFGSYIDKAVGYANDLLKKEQITPEQQVKNLAAVRKAKHEDYFKDSDGNVYMVDLESFAGQPSYINVNTGEQYLGDEALSTAISLQPSVRHRAINLCGLTPVKTDGPHADSAYDEWLEENMDKFSDEKDEIAFANTKGENGKSIREAKEVSEVEKAWGEYSSRNDGGPGSGNWGHEGREGKVGGSSPGDEQEASETAKSITSLREKLKDEPDRFERERKYEKLLDDAKDGESFFMVFSDGSVEEYKKENGEWKSIEKSDDGAEDKVRTTHSWNIAENLAGKNVEFAETQGDADRAIKKIRADNLKDAVYADDKDIDRLNGICEKVSESEFRSAAPYEKRKEAKTKAKAELAEALDDAKPGTVLYVSNESRNGVGWFTYAISKGDDGKWYYVNPKTGAREDRIGSAKDVAEQYVEYNSHIGFSKDYESVKTGKKALDERMKKLETAPVDTSDMRASKEAHATRPGKITYQSEDFGKPGEYVIYRQGNLGNGSMMFFAPKKEGADIYAGARQLGDEGPTGEYEVKIKNPLIIRGNGDVDCINKAYNALHPDKPKRIENGNQWMKADAANASAMQKSGYDAIIYIINGEPSEVQIPKKRIKEVKKTGSYTTTAWSRLGLTFEDAKRKGYYEKDPHDYERVDGRFDADDDTFDPDDLYYFLKDKQLQENVNKDGGPGSGNFGHKGVKGQIGGSAPTEKRPPNAAEKRSLIRFTGNNATISEQDAENIENAIEASKGLDPDLEYSRGISITKSELDDLLQKGIYKPDRLTSWSADESVADWFAREGNAWDEDKYPVVLKYRGTKNLDKGMEISAFSQVPDEDEFVFSKSIRMKIAKDEVSGYDPNDDSPTGTVYINLYDDDRADGGPGSGNFGHEGRKGEVGGSAPAKYSGLSDEGVSIIEKHKENPYHFRETEEQKQKNRETLIKALKSAGVDVSYDSENETYSAISTAMSYQENRDMNQALNQSAFSFGDIKGAYLQRCREEGKEPRLHWDVPELEEGWFRTKSGKIQHDGTPVYDTLGKESVLSDSEIAKFSGLDREVNPEEFARSREAAAKAIEGMTPQERSALYDYTRQYSGANYQWVNAYLITGEGTPQVKEAAERITSALDHEIGVDCITCRGDGEFHGLPEDEAINKIVRKIERGDFSAAKKLKGMLEGKTVENKAAMSTSPNDTTSDYGKRPVQYVFRTPKNAKAVDISSLSAFGGGRSEVEKKLAATGLFGSVETESEVLFKPGTRYRIDDVQYSMTVDRKGKKSGQVFIVCTILTGNEDSRTDAEEPKDWITINGTHVPLDESGNITGNVAEKIKSPGSGKSETKNSPLKDLHPNVEYPERVEYWKEQIKKGNHRPVLVDKNDPTRVIDGNHTLAAYQELGIEPEVYEMDRIEFLNGAGEADDTVEYIRTAIKEGKAKKIGGTKPTKAQKTVGEKMKPINTDYEYDEGDDEDTWMQKNVKKLMPIYKKGGSDAIDEEYRKFKMSRVTKDVHQISKEDADAIVYDHVRQSLFDGWFRNADSSYKPALVDRMLSSPEMRNAGLSLAYENYRQCTDSPLSFEEFLTTPIKMYRGGHGQKHTKDDVFSAYTFDRKTAEKFAGKGGVVTEVEIRPIDTYGSMRSVGEAEIWVPSEIAPNGNKDSREDGRSKPFGFRQLKSIIENISSRLKKPLAFRSRSAIVKSKKSLEFE